MTAAFPCAACNAVAGQPCRPYCTGQAAHNNEREDSTMKHKLEQTAKVYLLWDSEAQAWVVDPLTYDGGALDGSEDGVGVLCENLPDDEWAAHGEYSPACDAEADNADRAGLPNAEELLRMLAQALGYTLATYNGTTLVPVGGAGA